MEKAVLKTLIYSDIFDYPLKGYEIHKWLIGRNANFQQIEKSLSRLSKKGKIKSKKGHFFLRGKENLVQKRLTKEKYSKKYFQKAKFCSWFLKVIPTLKLVGISGGLALNNADKNDDIDLFLVTARKRLWLTRFLVVLILDLIRVRRKAGMTNKQVSGKICVNIIVEEDFLEQSKKDLYVSHEVLQMKVLWQRGDTYKRYLEKNSWAFNFLPNWVGEEIASTPVIFNWILPFIAVSLENLAKQFQLKIMQKPKGAERIQEGALYFHPNDIREKILKVCKKRFKKL